MKYRVLCLLVACLMCAAVAFAQEPSYNGGVLNGKALSMPLPDYPKIAKQTGAAGTVYVEIVISEEGKVVEAKAVEGHPLLLAAGVSAARQATFTPTTMKGKPVKVKGVLIYDFKPPEALPINGGDLTGRASSLPTPDYPAIARSVHAEGEVVVEVVISEDGAVVAAKAVSGHDLLKAAAVKAARQATFKPTKLDGKPVKVTGVIKYTFKVPSKD